MIARVRLRLVCWFMFSIVGAIAHAETYPQNLSTPVFRIGEFNRSSIDLAPGLPTGSVNFVVSKSVPSKDWFGVHRAVLANSESSASDPASAPRIITFSIDHREFVDYRLHIALIIETASLPALKVGVNGKFGSFFLHPKLDYGIGNEWGFFDPAYSTADIEFLLQGSDLKTGVNTITLQPVEDADEAVPDAGISYDAIELTRVPHAATPAAVQAQIIPTVFFQRKHGQIQERVDAFLRYTHPTGRGSVDLTIASKRYRCPLHGSQFGEEKCEFLVSEFAPGSSAALTVDAGGKIQRFWQAIEPAKKWTVYIVPGTHLDIGFTDYQAKVAAIQARTIEEAMDLTARNPDFRFSLDGEWGLEQYLATHSEQQRYRAIEAIRNKQLFVPAQYANLLTGIPTAETLIRSFYPSANFSRQYGTPLDFANITDVPSYSWSYASILASAGIRYFAAGSDNFGAPVLLRSRLNERPLMWWQGPDGKRVLLWYSRHYLQMQTLFGMPPVVEAGRDKLPIFLGMHDKEYLVNATIMFGTQVENTDLYPQQAQLAQKWNSIYAYPHLQYSGFQEALSNIEAQLGEHIPTIRGDGGPYWEDGAAADAKYVALERQNEARAPTAEKLATLTPLIDSSLQADTAELSRMWNKLVLLEEHTWTSYNSVTDPTSSQAVEQLAYKERYATDAAADIDFITRRNLAVLADKIPAQPDSVIVFNSLNWKRSGLVTLDIPLDKEIVDCVTNQPIAYEVLHGGPNFSHVRFMAAGVPSLGYKVYKLKDAKKSIPFDTAGSATILENSYYKLQLDAETGAVRSLYDKQLQRELVRQDGPYRFGEYLYVTGGDKMPNSLLRYDNVSPKPDLQIHNAHGGKIVSVTRTPFGQVARLESLAENTASIKAEILLFDDMKKIEFIEDVDKKQVNTKEAAYFVFPFAMRAPQFQYEIQNGVVDPAKDMYPGAGKEWFTTQHWVAVQERDESAAVMSLDAPLVTLGDINRGEWPEIFGTRKGTIFSYTMNNYWDRNYPASQGGHFTFRYVVTSAGSTNGAVLSSMGWEEATPLESDIITSQDKAIDERTHAGPGSLSDLHWSRGAIAKLGSAEQSLLETDDPNVLLETWKPAEDGEGTILRFVDFGATERSVHVTSPVLNIDHVWLTDALERGKSPIVVDGSNHFHFTIHPYEIATLRVVNRK